jgi:threonine/homoserine/homoserine lactone efflux protein
MSDGTTSAGGEFVVVTVVCWTMIAGVVLARSLPIVQGVIGLVGGALLLFFAVRWLRRILQMREHAR